MHSNATKRMEMQMKPDNKQGTGGRIKARYLLGTVARAAVLVGLLVLLWLSIELGFGVGNV